MGRRGRSTGKLRKKVKLQRRRKELIESSQNRSKKNKTSNSKKKKKVEVPNIAARLLNPQYKTLLVGEGDFSFTRGLIRLWEKRQREELGPDAKIAISDLVGFNVVSTCLDSKEELVEKYPEVKDIVAEVKASGVTVHTGIDATNLLGSKRLVRSLGELCQTEDEDDDDNFGFDRIIFNFPHLGCGISDTERNNQVHKDMLMKFFASAGSVLASDGQIHVSVKIGEPYDSWRVPQIAVKAGFTVHSSSPFDPSLYEGYQHRRTVGAPTKELTPNVDISSAKTASRTLIFVKKSLPQTSSDDEGNEA